jgi:amino acid transporter
MLNPSSSTQTTPYSDKRTPKTLPSASYLPQVMPRVLGTFDLTFLLLPTILWASNVTGVVTGGNAAFTYWILGAIFFFFPCAFVVAQLAHLFPYEGSLYHWTYQALGGFWSFFVAVCGWLPGVLSIVSAAFVIVSCLQTLNPQWLIPVWQQGLVILLIIGFSWLLAQQRLRVVQNLTNIASCALILAILIIGFAAVIWLISGRHSATDLNQAGTWAVTLSVNPQATNIGLLGTTTLALLGLTMPLSMAGEVKDDRAIVDHLKWGAPLIIIGYLILTASLLIVRGATAAQTAANPMILLIGTADAVFGKVGGNITMICFLFFFLMIAVIEQEVSARLLLVASVDGHIPVWFARLNKVRAPANAVLTQTIIVAIYTVLAFFVLPQMTFLPIGNPANLNFEVYNVTAASLLIVWAVSFLFPFLDLAVLTLRKHPLLQENRIVPQWILSISTVTGPLTCLITIAVTLEYSFVPQLIPSTTWLVIVGLTTIFLLLFCAIGSFIAQGEAAWEGWKS